MTRDDAYRLLAAFGQGVATETHQLDRRQIDVQTYRLRMQALLDKVLRDLGFGSETTADTERS